MSRDRSFAAVKKAIGGGSSFSGKRNVLVSMGERTFLYKDVFVSATYNIAYMQSNRQNRQRLDRHGTIVVGSCETFHHYNVQGVK